MPGLLDEASDTVLAWCRPDGSAFPEPIPDAVIRVTARAVARVIALASAPSDLSALPTVVGPFQWPTNPDATSGSPWLTRADRAKLKPYRNVHVQNVSTY